MVPRAQGLRLKGLKATGFQGRRVFWIVPGCILVKTWQKQHRTSHDAEERWNDSKRPTQTKLPKSQDFKHIQA